VNVSQAVARVYAEALLDLGLAQDNLPRIVDDLDAVRKLFDEDALFRGFFGSPRLDRAVKKQALSKAFAGKLDRPVLGLLHVLVNKQREMILDNIVDEFHRFRDLREGVVHAHTVSARPLGDEEREEIKRKLTAATGKQVRLHERVDETLLGGLVLRLGDKVIDGTLRRRLDGLRRALVEQN
jgi:F-type H+-transporting ATPase subunit delta